MLGAESGTLVTATTLWSEYARPVGGALAPSLAVYHDVARVRGTYAEAGLRHVVPAGERLSLAFAGVAGVSLGQGADAAGAQTAYFAGDGVTHVDLSASATWTTGAATITPTVHAMLDEDPATRLTAPGEQRRGKLMVGVALGWARTLIR